MFDPERNVSETTKTQRHKGRALLIKANRIREPLCLCVSVSLWFLTYVPHLRIAMADCFCPRAARNPRLEKRDLQVRTESGCAQARQWTGPERVSFERR